MKTRQVRIEEELADRLTRLASLQNPPVPVPDLLDVIVRPFVDKEYPKALEREKARMEKDRAKK